MVVELYIYEPFLALVTFSPIFNVISRKLDLQQTNLVQVVNVTAWIILFIHSFFFFFSIAFMQLQVLVGFSPPSLHEIRKN